MNDENGKNIQLLTQSKPIANDSLCRLCANANGRIIGIYSEEGLSNDLSNKMNLYLPIKVSENDTLPLQCCWNCASTILAWHELVVVSVEADRKLRSILHSIETKPHDVDIYESFEELTTSQLQDERLKKPVEGRMQSELTCQICQNTFTNPGDVLEHTQQQHLNTQSNTRRCSAAIEYKIFCDICNKGFTRNSDMNKHKVLKHASEDKDKELQVANKILVCSICNTEFKKECMLNKHLKDVHKKSKIRIRRSKSEIDAEHFCDICSSGFTRKFDMQKHRKKKHPDHVQNDQEISTRRKNSELLERCKVSDKHGSVYKCETCSRIFSQAYNFVRHHTIHTGVREYFCHICGKDFRLSGGLHRHITEHHYGVKKYNCDICDKSFAAKTTRDEHRNIHTNNRPFVCSICGKSFKQKASLNTHMLFHSNNYRFSCNICDKKYRRATELKLHSWMHSGHKPYQCLVCLAKFRLPQDLKRHGKVHDKLKECICHECGAKFSQERYLKNHKKRHLKDNSIT